MSVTYWMPEKSAWAFGMISGLQAAFGTIFIESHVAF